ncbi:MAG: putative manganese-dependent inorganic diphosphatase [Clostridiaceae bacterium]
MEPIYITGHRNPDTDSIVAAISYAMLKNALGERAYLAARIGELSDQTEMLLKKFDFPAPMLLHTVRTQVSDLDYDTPPILSAAVSVYHAWQTIVSDTAGVPTLPVTDEEGRLYGMLTPEEIAAYDMRFIKNSRIEGIPIFNLLASLDGRLIRANAEQTVLSGTLVISLPTHAGLPEINEDSVVLCGNQPDVIRHALEKRAAAVIVCESEVPDELVSADQGSLVISTPFDAYTASRLVILAVPVSRICRTESLVSFHLTDYLDEVRELTLKSRFRSYPILDDNDHVVGTLSRFHLLRPKRKRVVLVDHNELHQSIPGLEQAEILEIIDHHRLAEVETDAPVYVRNEPVGSTCTIITSMFFERGVMPSKKLAGLLAAAIVTDTIVFKSPTSTAVDHAMAERMAKIAGLSLEKLGQEIFSVSPTDSGDLESLYFTDFKQFQIAGHSIGISQITSLDTESLSEKKQEFVSIMERESEQHSYNMMLLMLTDVLKEGTLLIAVGDLDSVEHAFNVSFKNHAAFLPGVISRKKQIVPALSLLWG